MSKKDERDTVITDVATTEEAVTEKAAEKIPTVIKRYEDFGRGTDRLAEKSKTDFTRYEAKELQGSPGFKSQRKKQSSADWIKLLTSGLTGKFALDAQNCLIMVREFVNTNFVTDPRHALLEPTLSLGRVFFRTRSERTKMLNLRPKEVEHIPTGAKFEKLLKELVG